MMTDDNDYQEAQGPSKTRIKQAFRARQELAAELLALPVSRLQQLSLPEDLMDALSAGRSMTRTALKRQTKFIGGLIDEEQEADIRQTLERLARPDREAVARFHQLEDWRDKLLGGDDELAEMLLGRYPALERQRLRQLLRNARQVTAAADGSFDKRPARQLYRYLSDCCGDDDEAVSDHE